MVGRAVQRFPHGAVVLQDHIAVGALRFRDGHGAGIEIQIALSKSLPGRNMGVAVEQDVSRLQRRPGIQRKPLPMGGIEQAVSPREDTIVRQDREVQNHLIHLRIAVAPDAEDPVLPLIQHGKNLFRCIVPGQIIPRAMVQQVAQKQQPVSLLPLKGLHELPALVRRAVNIRRNHPFHFTLLLILYYMRICRGSLSAVGIIRTPSPHGTMLRSGCARKRELASRFSFPGNMSTHICCKGEQIHKPG